MFAQRWYVCMVSIVGLTAWNVAASLCQCLLMQGHRQGLHVYNGNMRVDGRFTLEEEFESDYYSHGE